MSDLSIIRVGTFSGSGTSVRDAIARRVAVEDFDLISAAGRPELWPARLAARLEAARSRDRVPFSKTAAWSKALQRALPSELLKQPTLFIQTTTALKLGPEVCYGIYTDRLGREGMAGPSSYRSRATPGWVEREQHFVESAQRLFVMGPTTRDYAIHEYGLDPARVLVVGGAPNTVLAARRSSTACRRLLFVGVDWQRKGLPDLLQAFGKVRETHPDLLLDVIGGRPGNAPPAGVNFIGRVPHAEIPQFLAHADLLVIPTYAEAFGIALVEALTMGIPVIGTTVGNQGWIIGDAGLTVEPGDVKALAAAIVGAIRDYELLKKKAEARSGELLATMTWDSIADRIVAELLGDQVCGS